MAQEGGQALVEFALEEEAKRAVEGFDKVELMDSVMLVSLV